MSCDCIENLRGLNLNLNEYLTRDKFQGKYSDLSLESDASFPVESRTTHVTLHSHSRDSIEKLTANSKFKFVNPT